MDIRAIGNTLNNNQPEPEQVEVIVTAFGSIDTIQVTSGTTIRAIRQKYELNSNQKITDGEGYILPDDTVIDEDMEIYFVSSKKNGKKK